MRTMACLGAVHRYLFLPVMYCLLPAVSLCENEPVVSPPRPPQPTQEGRAANGSPASPSIRVDTTLVQVNVTVTDPLNRFVTGIDKDRFQLFEDKVEQTILGVSSEDAPLSVGVVFDTSASMGAKLHKAREAVLRFLKDANPEDEFFLMEFSDRPDFVLPFTRDPEVIQNRLAVTQSNGTTALLDAVYLAMQGMKQAHNPRKAILIFSDGGDNNSRYTERDLRNAVREADVQIYGIGIFEPAESQSRTWEEFMGPSLLNSIAGLTGGRAYAVGDLNELLDVSARIGIELRNQYVLYYSPRNQARDGKFRHVRVKLNKPDRCPPLRVAFRLGYFAPGQ